MRCKECNANLALEANFCGSCGATVSSSNTNNATKEDLNMVLGFYVSVLVFSIIYFFIAKDGLTLTEEFLVEGSFALVMVAFSFTDAKSIKKLFRFPKMDVLIVTAVFVFPILNAFAVDFYVEKVNLWLGEFSENIYFDYIDYPYPMLLSLFFWAILPAIFEELGFRGFLFSKLEEMTSVKMTIFLTAFIFAIIHLSIISLFWIFPFGLLLGYLRHKYQSLWPGILIHLFHNSLIVLFDYWDYVEIICAEDFMGFF